MRLVVAIINQYVVVVGKHGLIMCNFVPCLFTYLHECLYNTQMFALEQCSRVIVSCRVYFRGGGPGGAFTHPPLGLTVI